MRIKKGMEEDYKIGLENNRDEYGSAVFRYAERWAELMEQDIDVTNIDYAMSKAEKRSHEADTEGITGFMYGCAVNILSQVWEYGESLRQWHNGKYGHYGDGVVNPAILTIAEE